MADPIETDRDPFALNPEREFVAFLPSPPTWQEYAEQYFLGAKALLLACCSGKCEVYVDSCPYPIAYLYRHYVELSLKAIGAEFRRLNAQEYLPEKTHKLDTLRQYVWDCIGRYVPNIPEQEAAHSNIEWFCKVDFSSFEFRYPVDNRERRMTLQNSDGTRLAEIRLDDLRSKMDQLHHFLSCLLASVQQIQNQQ